MGNPHLGELRAFALVSEFLVEPQGARPRMKNRLPVSASRPLAFHLGEQQTPDPPSLRFRRNRHLPELHLGFR